MSDSNGQSDRDDRGRFQKGNPGGPGNPLAGDVARQRARFYAALKDDDAEKALMVIRSVMNGMGKDADKLAAAREMLDRIIGRAVAADLLERIEAIEAALAEKSRA